MEDSHEQIRRFMIAFNRIDVLYLRIGKVLGVKGNQFVLFYALADGRVYSQKQICEDWSLPRTTLNSIVRECVQEGYVRLLPRGNKEKDVILTAKGRAVVDKTLGPLFAAEAEAMKSALEQGALAQIETLADRFEQAFAKITR